MPPGQFDGLNFSVHHRRRSDQYDLIALESDVADQVLVYIVLNRRDFDVMGYLVVAERILSSIRNKCLKRLSLFFGTIGGREWLSSAVADQGGHSAIFRIGKKTHRVGAIGSFVLLPRRGPARSGHQPPRAYKFVV